MKSLLACLALTLAAGGALAAPAPSAAAARPLAVGARLPAAEIRALDGATINLADLAAGRPTLVVFYRGSWCPYCNKHLAALQEIEPDLLALGVQIIALSPDDLPGLEKSRGQNHLNYRLFSDRAMHAADAFGLAFRVDATTRQKYAAYGIALAPIPGDPDPEARWLPVPAAYLIDRKGTVKFAFADPDYKVRLAPAELLAAARAAKD